MNLQQAIEHANAFVLPAFLADEPARTAEREKNEEAIGLLRDAWMSAPAGREPYSFDLVRNLADRNRELCDLIGEQRLRELRGTSLAQRLSDEDIVRSAAALRLPCCWHRTRGTSVSHRPGRTGRVPTG